jgi:hypothetical protein
MYNVGLFWVEIQGEGYKRIVISATLSFLLFIFVCILLLINSVESQVVPATEIMISDD